MKKKLFLLSAAAMLLVMSFHVGPSATSDLMLENVEALSAGEVHLGYKVRTGACPPPVAYKRWVQCASGGDAMNCMPSDC